MCGIIYVKRKDGRPAYKSVLKRYYKQKNRGSDGFGYVAVQDNKVVNYMRSPVEHEIVTALRKETATEILFHHRFPTSVPNIEEGAHPLYVTHESEEALKNQYFVVHNGVIRNDDDIKKEHEKAGFKYRTEIFRKFITYTGKEFDVESKWNDSEALAVETALALDGKKDDIDTVGVAAVIAFQVQGEDVIGRFAYRNSNPLNYYSNDALTILSSEGGGTPIDNIKVQIIADDGTLSDDPRRIFTPKIYAYNTNNYDHLPYRGMGGGDTNESHTAQLPKGHSGFLTGKEVDEYQDDDPAESTIIPFEPIEVLHIGASIKNMGQRLVSFMTEDALWKEFDRVIGIEEDIDHGMQVFEDRITDMGYDDAMLSSQLELEETQKKIKDYRVMLEDEITKRESGALITRSF